MVDNILVNLIRPENFFKCLLNSSSKLLLLCVVLQDVGEPSRTDRQSSTIHQSVGSHGSLRTNAQPSRMIQGLGNDRQHRDSVGDYSRHQCVCAMIYYPRILQWSSWKRFIVCRGCCGCCNLRVN